MKFSLLALILVTVVTVGCQKKDAKDSPIGGVTTVSKAMLSSWSLGPWGLRLDVNANLNSNPFVLIVKYADASEIQCTGTVMHGDEISGTIEVPGPCVATGGGAAMAHGNETTFTFVGVGSYTNGGGQLSVCHPGGFSCLDYN